MTVEGRPTGTKVEDVNSLGIIDFEGRRAQITRANLESHGGMGHALRHVLDIGIERLVLWGYYNGGEFMEIDGERLG